MTAHPYDKTIILAGSGRSGTTWLGNILGAAPTTRVIFEPLDYRRVPEARDFPLRPYARPHAEYPHWKPVIENILTGRISNRWTDQEHSWWWPKALTLRRLVKTIRGTLLLGWLSSHFGCPIVYITRHPCAVVLSRLKLRWEPAIDALTQQPELVTDYLSPYMDLILGAETPAQRHAVMWCVENLIPLNQMPHYDWHFCTYETLCQQPDKEARRLLGLLKLNYNSFTRNAISRISSVARSDSAIATQGDLLSGWKTEMQKADIDAVLHIVNAFGINLYTADPLPHVNSLGRHAIDAQSFKA